MFVAVMVQMFGAGHHLQIRRVIIQFVAVFVMHHFVAMQYATEHGFHHEPMFSNASAWYRAQKIAERIDGASAAASPLTLRWVAVAAPQVVMRLAHIFDIDAIGAAFNRAG